MIEIEGIEIPVTVDYTGVAAGMKAATDEVKKFGNQVTGAASTVKQSGTDMQNSFKGTADRLKESGAQMETSYRTMALGMSQVATSAFSLYQSFDNIEKKQYAVEKATLAQTKAAEAVKKAQDDYNKAVEKYGVDSDQAQQAAKDLAIATDAAGLADERVKLSQNNLNDSMTMAALTVIPGVISGIDGLSRAWKSFGGLDPVGMIGKIKDAFSSLGSDKIGILAGVGLGVGSVITTFKALHATTKDEKEMWTGIAMATNAATAAIWMMNVAKAFGIALTPIVGAAIIAGAGLAAAGTYLLAQQYGAKVEEPPTVPTGGGAAGGGGGGTAGGGGKGISLHGSFGRQLRPEELLTVGKLTAQGLTPGTEKWIAAGGPAGWITTEMPSVTPGAEMTGEQMAAAGLGEYIAESGTFIPNEGALIHDDIAFKVSQGSNKGKYKWLRGGPEKGLYFTMEDLKRIQRGEFTSDDERDIRPWFTYGFDERTDDLGNVFLEGKHFQKGGLAFGDVLGIVEKNEVVLPLEDTRAMDRIAAAIGGGGGTVNNYYNTFYVDGSRDVDYITQEIAKRMRTAGGMPY